MDIKIFNELKNKGAVTNPFVKHTDFKDFEDLVTKGYANGIGVKELYNSIIMNNELTNTLEEQTPEENINLEKIIIDINNVANNTEETIVVDNTEETVKEEPTVKKATKKTKKVE